MIKNIKMNGVVIVIVVVDDVVVLLQTSSPSKGSVMTGFRTILPFAYKKHVFSCVYIDNLVQLFLFRPSANQLSFINQSQSAVLTVQGNFKETSKNFPLPAP
jgi:hypothetical protein